MERIQASVPKPLKEQIEDFQDDNGYDTESGAVREILRRGLEDSQPTPTIEDIDRVLQDLMGDGNTEDQAPGEPL